MFNELFAVCSLGGKYEHLYDFGFPFLHMMDN